MVSLKFEQITFTFVLNGLDNRPQTASGTNKVMADYRNETFYFVRSDYLLFENERGCPFEQPLEICI